MLRIISEYRAEIGNKYFPDRLDLVAAGRVLFNAAETVIHLDNPDRRPWWFMISQMKHPQQPRFMDVIQHLGIDTVPLTYQGSHYKTFSEFGLAPEFLLAFAKLKSVSMIAWEPLGSSWHGALSLDGYLGFHRPDDIPKTYEHEASLLKKHRCSSCALAVGDGVVQAIERGRDAAPMHNKKFYNSKPEHRERLKKVEFRRMAVIENHPEYDLPEIESIDKDADITISEDTSEDE